jgi:hypothetical protein
MLQTGRAIALPSRNENYRSCQCLLFAAPAADAGLEKIA